MKEFAIEWMENESHPLSWGWIGYLKTRFTKIRKINKNNVAFLEIINLSPEKF